jgi:hypothetical protein
MWYRNLLIVFLVSGLWHGANWTFIVWGLLHGIFFIAPLAWSNARQGSRELTFAEQPWWQRALKMILTFHLVCVAWVFFRAESIGDAWLIITKIFQSVVSLEFAGPATTKPLPWIALLLGVEWLAKNHEHGLNKLPLPKPVRWGFYYAMVLAVLYVTPLNYVPFIYFQF